MRKIILTALGAGTMLFAFPSAAQDIPLVNGNYWNVTEISIDDGHFSEEAPFAQHGEDDLAPILRDEHHLDLSCRNQKEGIPRIVLEYDDAAFGVTPLSGQIGKRREVGLSQTGEEGNLPEDLHRGQGHSRLGFVEVFGGSILASGRSVNQELKIGQVGMRCGGRSFR